MAGGILGKKLGMTQVFDENGRIVPVTVIKAGPCVVMQVKTTENDGYEALQLGFGDKKRSRANKAETGIARKSQTEPKNFVREIRQPVGDHKEGDVVDLSAFSDTHYVDVTGITKGKGFAGVMKRWGFNGYPASHGHRGPRAPGSIGQSSNSSRVFKGMKMAGHMGSQRRTVKRLPIVKMDPERNLLFVKGAVPGTSYLIVKTSTGVQK